ncbi:hypothetical protein ACFSN5_06490 [Streptococcus tangpeifui]|uniref:hypothetical protein n=1 Tax=Streptococcus tangpeifui TaxID=2709400 RepID=UPI0013EC0013|nr:hypothetical protein [Streptococcus sp. ZJ1593]
MFGKLVKYEFKAIGHWYLALNGLILLASLVLSFYASYISHHYDLFESGGFLALIFILVILAFACLIVGQLIATLILIIRRFYSNLFGREGYLTLTLPVKESQLISSKLLVATTLTIGNCIVIALSLGLIYSFVNHQDTSAFYRFFKSASPNATVATIRSGVLLSLVSAIISWISNILLIYASITVGQLFRNHRVLMAFVCYFVIEGILTFISSFLQLATGSKDILTDYNTRLIVGSIIDAALALVWYLTSHYIIKNKVDIQ